MNGHPHPALSLKGEGSVITSPLRERSSGEARARSRTDEGQR